MIKIPILDIKRELDEIGTETESAVLRVLKRGDFILGEDVKLLEEETARYLGSKYAVGVASGTDALILSIAALGIGAGDEIITTPFTFIATSEAVSRCGARPVFADIDPETLNVDPIEIEKKITPKTKAILPVHLYGNPADMDSIFKIAKKHNLKIIEDCAQAFGASYLTTNHQPPTTNKTGVWKRVGTLGSCGCFSFFPAKNLGAYGDGGMIATDSEEIYEKLKMLRNHGCRDRYFYLMHGFNSRLDTIHAAVLRVKLKYIDNWVEKRRQAALWYHELLKDVPQINFLKENPSGRHAQNYFTVKVTEKRKELQEHLQKEGIASAVYYPLSLHLQLVYQNLGYKKGDFPVSENFQEEVLSFPIFPQLTQREVKLVTDKIKVFYKE